MAHASFITGADYSDAKHVYFLYDIVLFLRLLYAGAQVACGFAYTAAVTASGELYTWGAGENGRLGLGDVEDRHTPSRWVDRDAEQIYRILLAWDGRGMEKIVGRGWK